MRRPVRARFDRSLNNKLSQYRLLYFYAIMKRLVLLLQVLIWSHLPAQVNLVPNGDFEDSVIVAPFATAPTYNWHNPFANGMTIYRDQCTPGAVGVNCTNYYLTNSRGGMQGHQVPHSGTTYTSVVTIGPLYGNTRQYITCELSSPLRSDRLYEVSMYYSLADSSYFACDGLGIALTTAPFDQCNQDHFLNISPISENPQGMIISDTVNWVHYIDTIQPAGGERYICIGNFRNDTITTWQMFTGNSSYLINSTIYIDDVSITDAGAAPLPPVEYADYTFFPNPSAGDFIVQGNFPEGTRLEVYNALGQKVSEVGSFPTGNNQVNVNLRLASGAYFFQLTSPEGLLKKEELIIAR